MSHRTLIALPLAATLILAACERTTTAPAPEPSATHDASKQAGVAPEPAAFAYDEADVAGLQSRMEKGELSSHALTQAYLDRIAAIDDAGPRLNAVIEINPDALKEADARDAERKAGRLRGTLHGIPVLLKDNIDATPMVNSAGSLALANHRPAHDAFLVQRLREAGAVILGKTNLSEWANIRSTRSTSGWSARGGQTRNPYALDRSPCGSSSGTGSAIAANLATVGIGTETDGSILCPAAVAGLVGIKPTVGLVSRSGIIPISHSQDTAGPMARSVADAAALLAAISGRDDADVATQDSVGHAIFDYRPHLKADGLKGARIGVVRKLMGYQPDVDAATERAIAAMKAAGAEIVDAEIPTLGQWNDAEFEVLKYELKADLESYLARSNAPVKTLAEVIEFNRRNASAEMPWFAQEIFEQAQAKGPLTDAAYIEARSKARRLAGPEGLDAALQAQQLDALIAPSMSPAWVTDLITGDHFTGAGYGIAAVAGTPSVTVPMGDSHGLPLGITFMGPAWSEPRLIELAYSFEQATKARKPPKFLPSVTPTGESAKATK
ncbi:amidase [Luteimonas cucumeris]|uniref:Amidase n=1 Tax=Luteimonas cucumeris TaxID=985012 RepID=A0A562L061_9GAMM|nr:amidase [Luteimonas cucumeris]TWI00916.1 amidase [Luteimonas cucumeris]